MKIEFDHINICSFKKPEVDKFYREIFGLKPIDSVSQMAGQGYDSPVSFLSEGKVDFHIAPRDISVSYRTNQPVNPMNRGHIAFRTDNIEEFKSLLREKKIPFADYGEWAVKGWYQIFFEDPEGTVIEVHQRNYGSA